MIRAPFNRFARSSDGYLAIGGAAYGDERRSGFLAIISPGGASQRIVRTDPYLPYAVAFASDGSIWTAGLETDSSGVDKRLADYFMLRHFDKAGEQLGGAFSRLGFPSSYTPVDSSMLMASQDRLGWFIPTAHRYMEFSLDGNKIFDFPLDVEQRRVEGATLCEDNTFWVYGCSGSAVVSTSNWTELDWLQTP